MNQSPGRGSYAERFAEHRTVPDITERNGRFPYPASMSHTYSSMLVHCVFSTKGRTDNIPDPEALWRYLGVVARDKKLLLMAAGGTTNHVHLLLGISPAMCLSTGLRDLKAHSSRWIGEHGCRFSWQEGYGAFSVSQSQRQVVIDYIDGQAEHHKTWSFEQEFLTLLKKSGLEYDPRFVFG
ncbi:MAG: transposase [Candidatus Korobacteraceae bacterium]